MEIHVIDGACLSRKNACRDRGVRRDEDLCQDARYTVVSESQMPSYDAEGGRI